MPSLTPQPAANLEEEMAKYIPGPWRADDNGDGTHCITAGRGCDVADTRSSAYEEANARLIAAAPQLLAACEMALPHLVNEPAADAVRAAIAQAKGE